jgi:cytochrome c peroxidase
MTTFTHRGRMVSASALCAAALVWGAVAINGQDDPLVKTEPLAAVIQRTQKEKPTFAKRQEDLLAARYDLANRAAPGVTMSRGKAVQDGVRVKLAGGMTWDKLATMTPEEIKNQNAWPAGFFPLPHPHHESGGMTFPKKLIEETKKQTDRDLERFDLDFDLPDHLLPDFPAAIFLVTRPDLGDVSKGELVTTANFERLFKDILNQKQLEGLRLLLRLFTARPAVPPF